MTFHVTDSEGNVIAADLEANDEGTQMLAVGIGGYVVDDSDGSRVFDGTTV